MQSHVVFPLLELNSTPHVCFNTPLSLSSVIRLIDSFQHCRGVLKNLTNLKSTIYSSASRTINAYLVPFLWGIIAAENMKKRFNEAPIKLHFVKSALLAAPTFAV